MNIIYAFPRTCSAVPAPAHFGEVMDRLGTVLPSPLTEYVSVDVIRVPRPSWTDAAPTPVPVAREDTTGL